MTTGRESLFASPRHAVPAMFPNVLDGLAPDQRDIVEDYLYSYADPGEHSPCPSCGSTSSFGWGIAWGAGKCRCGWPGRLYHVITDRREEPSLVCSAKCNGQRVCTSPRGDHEAVTRYWYTMDGPDEGKRTERIHLMCPDPVKPMGLRDPFTSEYRPPEIVEFKRILWAHPEFVS